MSSFQLLRQLFTQVRIASPADGIGRRLIIRRAAVADAAAPSVAAQG
jgi:hypothetical protein